MRYNKRSQADLYNLSPKGFDAFKSHLNGLIRDVMVILVVPFCYILTWKESSKGNIYTYKQYTHMGLQELRVEQNLVIVNKDLWDKTKQQAMYNEAEVVEMAEDMYKEHLKNAEITLNVTLDGQPIMKNLKFWVVETNFDIRSPLDPLDKQVAQGIADQIMEHVNAKYKGPVERANQIIADYKKQAIINMNTKFIMGLLIGGVSTAIAATLGAVICSIF